MVCWVCYHAYITKGLDSSLITTVVTEMWINYNLRLITITSSIVLNTNAMDKSLYTEYELQQLRDYGYVKYPVKKTKK